MYLYMILIGCTPTGRHTEQHDVFFGIGESLQQLLPHMQKFWPEANGLHLDAWRRVEQVDGYSIKVIESSAEAISGEAEQPALFFINLGGYKRNEFEEFHYKMISVGRTKADAIKSAKQTAFYKHTGFKGAESHVDDKYGIDVDNVHNIADILPQAFRELYTLQIQPIAHPQEDEIHLGYFTPDKIRKKNM